MTQDGSTAGGVGIPFDAFFLQATGKPPLPYQRRLATAPWPDILDIPTGLGKTAAVILAWIHKRALGDPDTPRRLVYCLPMRVLVEQTVTNTRQWLAVLERLGEPGQGRTSVQVLMGGGNRLQPGASADYPEEDAILIGTQDMLLSRALMRGYGMSRYLWPVDFAWLHNDALWVFDEIQLMGAGLATSAQLEAFRRGSPPGKPAKSLWMSATLDTRWLATVDLNAHLAGFARMALDDADQQSAIVRERTGALKHLAMATPVLDPDTIKQKAADYLAALAQSVLAAHQGGTTLVILNTVERAQGLFRLLKRQTDTPILLIHGRFRLAERKGLDTRLREAPAAGGRIVVATQAVEAGVDITSNVLFTELAPWSSLVQRFGRCNRYGELNASGGGRVAWLDVAADANCAAPYAPEDLLAARGKLSGLASAAPDDLPHVDQPPPGGPVIRRKDQLDLFDTDRDLSGFDVDVSAYIRDTGSPQLQVFWRTTGGDPNDPPQPAPQREELCPVSIGQAQGLGKRPAWVWDTLARRWRAVSGRLRPGMVLMLEAGEGGYDPDLGFTLDGREGKTAVTPLPPADGGPQEAFADDWRSRVPRAVTLPAHLANVARMADTLLTAVGEHQHREAVVRAARWHDVGKAHAVFQATLTACLDDPTPPLLAKSPCGGRHGRAYFRHEVASLLAWLDHGPPGETHDLIAYLIAAHHGKVRMSLRAMPEEDPSGQPGFSDQRFARGVWEGDRLPALHFDGDTLPDTNLRLAVMELGDGEQGASWTLRTQRLLAEYGPFRLAWLEALVRVADWRASAGEQAGELEIDT